MKRELEIALDHGVLFVSGRTDAYVEDYNGERIRWNDTCIAVAGQHEVDGPVRVVLTDDLLTPPEENMELLYNGELASEGVLYLSTADTELITLPFEGRLEIRTDQMDATQILISFPERLSTET